MSRLRFLSFYDPSRTPPLSTSLPIVALMQSETGATIALSIRIACMGYDSGGGDVLQAVVRLMSDGVRRLNCRLVSLRLRTLAADEGVRLRVWLGWNIKWEIVGAARGLNRLRSNERQYHQVQVRFGDVRCIQMCAGYPKTFPVIEIPV